MRSPQRFMTPAFCAPGISRQGPVSKAMRAARAAASRSAAVPAAKSASAPPWPGELRRIVSPELPGRSSPSTKWTWLRMVIGRFPFGGLSVLAHGAGDAVGPFFK